MKSRFLRLSSLFNYIIYRRYIEMCISKRQNSSNGRKDIDKDQFICSKQFERTEWNSSIFVYILVSLIYPLPRSISTGCYFCSLCRFSICPIKFYGEN